MPYQYAAEYDNNGEVTTIQLSQEDGSEVGANFITVFAKKFQTSFPDTDLNSFQIEINENHTLVTVNFFDGSKSPNKAQIDEFFTKFGDPITEFEDDDLRDSISEADYYEDEEPPPEPPPPQNVAYFSPSSLQKINGSEIHFNLSIYIPNRNSADVVRLLKTKHDTAQAESDSNYPGYTRVSVKIKEQHDTNKHTREYQEKLANRIMSEIGNHEFNFSKISPPSTVDETLPNRLPTQNQPPTRTPAADHAAAAATQNPNTEMPILRPVTPNGGAQTPQAGGRQTPPSGGQTPTTTSGSGQGGQQQQQQTLTFQACKDAAKTFANRTENQSKYSFDENTGVFSHKIRDGNVGKTIFTVTTANTQQKEPIYQMHHPVSTSAPVLKEVLAANPQTKDQFFIAEGFNNIDTAKTLLTQFGADKLSFSNDLPQKVKDFLQKVNEGDPNVTTFAAHKGKIKIVDPTTNQLVNTSQNNTPRLGG